ncbi:LOW QUALITY PROTEIN: ATP-dependent translocase ABCB1-like [Asterias rubens]|uniref:LOW QUALITY PROTEIN: ATP-dependent translocase ABCB1-like n=1 Tax=Asterias rubens TaxID=7604 RepID=UPI0014552F67|nr:LOW QUALITY PROTEIN: ATP-dependent translocase ABCB1-like [Asterias rubens]
MTATEDDSIPNEEITDPGSRQEDLTEQKSDTQIGNGDTLFHENNEQADTAAIDEEAIELKTEQQEETANKEDSVQVKTRNVTSLQLFRFAGPFEVLLLIFAFILAITQGVSLPLVLFFFGKVTDAFIDQGKNYGSATNLTVPMMTTPNTPTTSPTDTITEYSIYYAILGVIIMIIAYLQNMLWNTAAERQIHKIRLQFFRAILRQEIAWFDTHKAGELTSRSSDDIDKIRAGFGDKLGLILQYLGTCCGGIALGFSKSWKLTLVILCVAFLIMLPSIAIGARLIRKMTTSALDAYAKAGAVAEEVLSSVRTVTAFGGEHKEVERYTENLYGAKKESIKKDTLQAILIGVFYFNFYGTYALAFWYGSTLYLSGELSPGDIIVTFLGILFGAFSLGQATPYITDFITARGAASTIWEIIDQIPDIDNSSELGLKPETLTGDISFTNVHFCYPSRPEVKVLNGLTLEVKQGQTVALVGSSGCGKSTTVQLAQRFYDPLSGSVKLDGNDLRDINVRWLRENIGVVSQEPVLFATTIAENIRYGRVDATDEEIKAAAKEANAHDFISALPDGYETLVGDRGAQLSGGQKQRVAIARALVRNPKILLLDEATSALDTESEATVQAALDKVQAGRTTIVIAHRLSTIQNADVICSFKDGNIFEKGSHEVLMQDKNGLYFGLVQLQSRKEEKTKEEAEVKEEEYEDEDEEENEEKDLDVEEEFVPMAGSVEAQKAEKEPLSSSRHRNISGSSDKQTPELNRVVSTVSDTPETQEDEEDVLKNFSFTRVMKMNSPELLYMIIGVICSAFNGGVQPAFSIIFSRILGTFALPLEEVQAQVVLYCLLLFGIGVIALISNTLGGASLGKSGGELTMRVRRIAFKAMLRQDIAYFDDHKNSSGALTTRLSTEASLISGVTGSQFGFIVQAFSNIGVAIIIAFIFGWQLTLLVLAFLPLIAFSGLMQMKQQRSFAAQQQSSKESIGKIVTETIVNIRTVANLTVEPTFYNQYLEFLNKPYKNSLKDAHLSGITYAVSQSVIFFCYAASFRLGGWLVENDKMEFQNIFLVFSAIVFGGFGLGRAMASAPDYSKAKTAAAHVFQLVDREPPIDSYSDKGVQLEHFSPEISFDKVRYRYPTRPDVPVLRGLTVSVKPGETLALVGSSGCGKSTSVSLIERFYNPMSGQVSLDNHEIKILNLGWFRSQIGLVSQEPILFDRTVADNIAYGDNSRKVSMEEVIDAAKKANIHDFIASLPEGYETRVGDKGTQLSGGQKQRVAIARALVRNPKILLLDEATSALDSESERVVQEALDEAKKGRTCITIAHRLSTIHDAEKIAVIRHGKVAEFGKHEELMQLKGQYYRLYTAQDLQN